MGVKSAGGLSCYDTGAAIQRLTEFALSDFALGAHLRCLQPLRHADHHHHPREQPDDPGDSTDHDHLVLPSVAPKAQTVRPQFFAGPDQGCGSTRGQSRTEAAEPPSRGMLIITRRRKLYDVGTVS